jgi:diguanylate cyclase
VVAGGVETQDELDQLRRFGCDAAQGWLLARPVPADRIADLLTGPPLTG